MSDHGLLTAEQKAAASEVVECLLAVLAPDEIEEWFDARLQSLDGGRPRELILAGKGELVVEAARRLRRPT